MSPSLWTRRWTEPGGGREVLRMALPLILSNSFWTLQITIDRVLLSRYSSDAIGAAMAAVILFWTCFTLLQGAAMYAATFVAQYLGAKQFDRVGPVIWQSLYFSTAAGFAFLLLLPVIDVIIDAGGHSLELQRLESSYFQCLCFAALPMLLTTSATSFFIGRGQNWIVMLVNAVGMLVNALLDYAWIFGHWGFPEMGITGAGWATVVGSWVAALVALILLFGRKYRSQFAMLSGWRFEGKLFKRMLRFGLPSGLQWMMEGLAFNFVVILIGHLGPAELAASSIAFSLNLVAFLPTMGIGQAVSVLVGQRLGENRPDLAERSTWNGFVLAWTFMSVVGLSFVLLPNVYLSLFRSPASDARWAEVAVIVPILLRFVALYCLFDSMNAVFSFALKGAGDIRFVTIASITLAWPIMVLPSWVAGQYGLGLYWAWGGVSAYVILLGFTFLWRFRQGKWKLMRVIDTTETTPEDMPQLVDTTVPKVSLTESNC